MGEELMSVMPRFVVDEKEKIARLRDTILEKTTKVSIFQLNAKTITYLRAVYSS